MADKKGYLKNLVPGNRYRMVIEAITNTSDPILLPSIEFVVPPSPELISAYTPVGRKTDRRLTGIKETTTDAVPGSTGGFNITHWSATDNGYSYRFWCNGGNYNQLKTGMKIRMNGGSTSAGISDYEDDHSYYDSFDYVVTAKTSTYIDTVVSSTVTNMTNGSSRALTPSDWCTKNSGGHPRHQYSAVGTSSTKRPDGWIRYYLDGRALKTRNYQPNTAAASFYIPGTPANTIKEQKTYTVWDVNVSMPDNFPLYKNVVEGVVDVPLFVYKNFSTQTWHLMDHSAFVPINYPPQYSNSAMDQLIYDRNGDGIPRRTSVPVNETSLNINRTTFNEATGLPESQNHTKEYYFTIMRYKKEGNVWNGSWLQSENNEKRVSDPSLIIWSQRASGTT
jgi:hypothetical protein